MTLQRVLPSAAPMTQQPALDLAVWEQLSQLARWAPTPHNTQPFRIRPRSPTQADVVALPERFLTMEDPGNRYCSASAGILAVALEKAAQHLGHVLTCVPTMDFDPASMSRATAPVTVASVTITGHCPPVPQGALLESRRTSRTPYTNQRIRFAAQQALSSVVSAAGHRLLVFEDPGVVETVLDLNANAIMDNLQVDHERREIEHWTHAGPTPVHGDGLWNIPLNQPGWELSAAFGAPSLFTVPLFRAFARWRQVRSQEGTPHIGLLCGPFDSWPQLYPAGRVLMELWLAMAHHGVVMQPFGSMLTNPSYAQRVARVFGVPDTWLIFRMGHGPVAPRSPRLQSLVLP